MENKIRAIKYFIFLTILLGMQIITYAIETPTKLTEIKYDKTSDIETLFKNNLNLNGEINYIKVPRGLIMSIGGIVFFESGNDEIKETSKPILDKIGELIKASDKPCIIEGHANFNEIESPYYDTNWEISIIRAQKIAQYLIEETKINPEKLSAIGFGNINPALLKNDISQRIDFIILNYESTDFNINPTQTP